MSKVHKLKRRAVEPADMLLPQVWRTMGGRLLKGAGLIWPPLAESVSRYKDADRSERRRLDALNDYFAPFFLLAAFGIENYLKGYMLEDKIRAGRTFKKPEELFAADMFGTKKPHDLIALAKNAGLTLRRSETRLLERLSAFALWAGRYHAPKHQKDAAFVRETRDRDWQEINRFVTKLGG